MIVNNLAVIVLFLTCPTLVSWLKELSPPRLPSLLILTILGSHCSQPTLKCIAQRQPFLLFRILFLEPLIEKKLCSLWWLICLQRSTLLISPSFYSVLEMTLGLRCCWAMVWVLPVWDSNHCPTAPQWFESYLCGRSCQVSVKGSVSSETQLKCGVPQGSVIGPQVFTLYSHVIGQIIRQHSVLYHIYADDVQLFLTFNPTIPGDAACALFKLTRCIKDLQIWMTNNKLMMNPDNHYGRLQHLSLCLDVEIFPSPTVRNLGTVFNHTMKMDDHVNQLSRSLNFHIHNLNRIRRFLDFDACHNAVRALILSKLDYCSCLLNGLTQKNITCLQRIQNRCA